LLDACITAYRKFEQSTRTPITSPSLFASSTHTLGLKQVEFQMCDEQSGVGTNGEKERISSAAHSFGNCSRVGDSR
jgi:hypothetical protein